MKITKLTHACLLVETPERTIILDPGNYAWESGLLHVEALARLDDIVITHEHPDHFDPGFVQALRQRFPQAAIIASPPVVKQLQTAGYKAPLSDQSDEAVEVFSRLPHADIRPIGTPPCEHIAVHVLGQLTHCGDRHDIEESKGILALPVTAPWGSTSRAAAMALELKPKTIIPIHDWQWRDEARLGMYDRLEKFFGEHGIRFIKAVNGEAFEV